jgi:type VI secretion system protein VasG
MKGEFENRLRQVIEEVQASEKPIILFIDEAHTLIGAGGAAGTGDAANLLKPALARGTLRTVAATTWAEYKKHIEKDPRSPAAFRSCRSASPARRKAILMMRGMASVLEQHHRVQVLDEAIEAAVKLSHRYIPARQLPDKSVSLLDTPVPAWRSASTPYRPKSTTAAAGSKPCKPSWRSSSAKRQSGRRRPAARRPSTKLTAERARLRNGTSGGPAKEDGRSGARSGPSCAGKVGTVEGTKSKLEAAADEAAKAETRKRPRRRVENCRSAGSRAPRSRGTGRAAFGRRAAALLDRTARRCKRRWHAAGRIAADPAHGRRAGRGLGGRRLDRHPGRPNGQERSRVVLKLADTAQPARSSASGTAWNMIARRIQTSRAGLDNPNKPIGVFMLAGRPASARPKRRWPWPKRCTAASRT